MVDNRPDDDELNARAYLAMSRLNADVVLRLVELFRSDAPIARPVRNAIADAFEGRHVDDRVTFEVSNKTGGALGDYGERRNKFHRDMAIARFIEDRRSAPRHDTLEVAAEAAETAFGIGVKTCKAAVGKHRKMEEWLRRTYPQRPHLFALLPNEQYQHLMEVEFHILSELGQLSEAARYR